MKYSIISINSLTEAQIDKIKVNYPLRYEKALKYAFHEDYLRCVAGYIALIDLIGDFDERSLTYNAYGKPYLGDNTYFNISHSGEYVIAVLDDVEIGVDIQLMSEKNLKLADKVLLPEEKMWMESSDSLERFHKLWAQKESVVKMLGDGLKIPFIDINVLPFNSNKKISYKNIKISNKTMIFDNQYVISFAKKCKNQ